MLPLVIRNNLLALVVIIEACPVIAERAHIQSILHLANEWTHVLLAASRNRNLNVRLAGFIP